MNATQRARETRLGILGTLLSDSQRQLLLDRIPGDDFFAEEDERAILKAIRAEARDPENDLSVFRRTLERLVKEGAPVATVDTAKNSPGFAVSFRDSCDAVAKLRAPWERARVGRILTDFQQKVSDGEGSFDASRKLSADLAGVFGAGRVDNFIMEVWTALDLKYAKLPKPASLLGDGVLTRGSLAVLYGRAGLGKSWLSFQLAQSITTATPFFGLPTTRGNVAVFSLESPPWQNESRLNALGEEDAGLELFTIVHRENIRTAMDLNNPLHVEAIIEHCLRYDVSILILDAMSRTHISDENDTKEMGAIMAAADTIRLRANVCVMFLHHERKPQGQKSKGADEDHLSALRGSSRLETDPHTAIRLTTSHGVPVLVCAKANWGKKFDTVWLEQMPEGYFKLGKQPADAKDHAARNRAAVLDFVAASEFPVTADEILFALGLKGPDGKPIKIPTIRGYLRALENESVVTSEGKTRDRRWRLNSALDNDAENFNS